MKRLLDYDPLTGITQYFHYDETDGKWGIESVQDVEPFLDRNKARQNDENYSKNGIKNDFWHVAHIPNVVIERWLREGIDVYNKDHIKKVRAKLNDPDYRYLKATSGRI